jgi:hypothetical protein
MNDIRKNIIPEGGAGTVQSVLRPCYELDGRGSIYLRDIAPTQALGPIQPPVRWVLRTVASGGTRSACEAHSLDEYST